MSSTIRGRPRTFLSRLRGIAHHASSGLAVFGSVLIFVSVATTIVQITDNNEGVRIAYTVLSAFPALISVFLIVYAFVVPLYDRIAGNDANGNFISYAGVLAAKIVAMSMVYMSMYLWNHMTYEEINGGSILENWLYILHYAVCTTFVTAAPSIIDGTKPYVSIVCALDMFLSKMLEWTTPAILLSNFIHFIHKHYLMKPQSRNNETRFIMNVSDTDDSYYPDDNE